MCVNINIYIYIHVCKYIYIHVCKYKHIYIIWGLPKMVVSKNGLSIMEHPIEIHD